MLPRCLLDAFPWMPQRCLKDAPKDASKMRQRCAPDASKMRQRRFSLTLFELFGCLRDAFRKLFGCVLAAFWRPFGGLLEGLSEAIWRSIGRVFGGHLKAHWKGFRNLLSQISASLGAFCNKNAPLSRGSFFLPTHSPLFICVCCSEKF